MKLLVIHLSDMHFENQTHSHSINIDKMLAAIVSKTSAKKCVILISGDLANKGLKNNYEYVKGFIIALKKGLKEKGFSRDSIYVLSVPGNHDIDFNSFSVSIEDVQRHFESETEDELEKKYIDNMKDYYSYSKENDCFCDNKVISKRIISLVDKTIGFVLVNSAPMSLLGGNALDMGNHYLSKYEMDLIEKATEADVNILVMHHSIEWYKADCKEKLRKIITKRYSMVISGHEHSSLGQKNCINNVGEVQFIQGKALQGYAEDGNGFCTISIDMKNLTIEGYSYNWQDDLYIPTLMIEANIRSSLYGEVFLRDDFINQLQYDSQKRMISDYYVFPSISYDILDNNKKIKQQCIDDEDEVFKLIQSKRKVYVVGGHKSGKSLLAKRVFLFYYNKGKKPILIEAADINKKKIVKTIDYVFPEEYSSENSGYEKYKQLDKEQKIAIIDGANLIQPDVLEKLVETLEQNVGQILIFSEEQIELNVRKQVVDVLVNDDEVTLRIKPFLYDKRKELIGNILRKSNSECNVETETTKINDLINMQVKYFDLDPEFIIGFVSQYESDASFRFTAGMNVFNIVYESSIRNSIIANSNAVDSMHVINVLRELAYNMHFEKKNSVKLAEISDVIKRYEEDYRQKVNEPAFINAVLESKILLENNNEYRFRDHTIIAYFVAQALNQKYNQEEKEASEKFSYLLKNLCFSINSDVILFLAFITNNPKIINIIIEGAHNHFANQEELSFDKENISFILDTAIPVKNSLPDKEERSRREKEMARDEEKIKVSELVELVNEYDYTEDDLNKIENQILISFKYLEILSKTLPAFCQNMKAEQQDKLVKLVYRCPNQFLFAIFKDINDNYEEFCNDLFEDISKIRKERNESEISIESVRTVVKQVSGALVTELYHLVAATCTNEQSITSINEFDYTSSTNYNLQNLMMSARVDDIAKFSQKAKSLDKSINKKLAKSIIKYTVRDYFFRNNSITLHGEAQSLLDYFFNEPTKKSIKYQIAKNKEKDRKY